RRPSSIVCSRRSSLLRHEADMQLPQGQFRDGGGGVGHEVAGLGGLGEGDYFADAVLAGEEHDDAVYAGGDAAVGRSAVLEGGEEVAEAGVGFLFAVA